MSTYGIKRVYQDVGMTQPIAENLCVASFLLTLRNGLVSYRPPEGGWALLFISPQSVSVWRIGYGKAALGGTKPGTRTAAPTVAKFD